MALLKTELPRFGAGESLGSKVNRIYRYLEQLQRSLDFVLSHLGAENMNGNGFTLPVRSADGRQELGCMGAAGTGVGLLHGDRGLRVSENGVEVTEDGRTWAPWESGTTEANGGREDAAPIQHAAREGTYGLGTQSLYGHVRIIDNLTQADYRDGDALSAHQGYLLRQAVDGMTGSYVPTTRTVNGKALSSNINLSASDVGARENGWVPTAAEVGAAPEAHASAGQTYGLGTQSLYGHVRIIDNLTQTDYRDGDALSARQGYRLKEILDSLDTGSAHLLAGGTGIPEYADVNDETYLVPGTYYIGSYAAAQTISNLPERTAGRLYVSSATGFSESIYRVQEFYPYSAPAKPYTRYVNKESGSWVFGAWDRNITANDMGSYVPTSRTVNGKALSANISLSASDVGAVPTTRTVNGKALSGNITIGTYLGTAGTGGATFSISGATRYLVITMHNSTPSLRTIWHVSGTTCTCISCAVGAVSNATITVTSSSAGSIRVTATSGGTATVNVIPMS